jgi:DNA-binding NarL/FixJ family response regulator
MSLEIHPQSCDIQHDAEVKIRGDVKRNAIALIDAQSFTRESFRLNLERAFSVPIDTYSSISEFLEANGSASASLIIINLCAADANNDISSQLYAPLELPVVVLSYQYDAGLGKAFFDKGVKGYILMSMNFDLALAAIRFVLAGGTYVPWEALLEAARSSEKASPALPPPPPPAPPPAILTERQLEVVRSIQAGKPNKLVALELNITENTVKAHLAQIMRKLNARNRTEVAIKAGAISFS